jgi:hypothetical protein
MRVTHANTNACKLTYKYAKTPSTCTHTKASRRLHLATQVTGMEPTNIGLLDSASNCRPPMIAEIKDARFSISCRGTHHQDRPSNTQGSQPSSQRRMYLGWEFRFIQRAYELVLLAIYLEIHLHPAADNDGQAGRNATECCGNLTTSRMREADTKMDTREYRPSIFLPIRFTNSSPSAGAGRSQQNTGYHGPTFKPNSRALATSTGVNRHAHTVTRRHCP